MPSVHDKAILANILTGPARVLYAPTTVAVPTKLNDIISLSTPYAPKTGWIDAGATADATSYERDMDSETYEIEQKTTAVLEKITSVERSLTVPFAEITSALQKIIEEGAAAVTIAVGAAASGTSAQTRQPFGSIGSLTRFRWAMIAERPKEYASGEGGLRGKLVGLVLYSASIAAEGSELEVGRDDLVSRECTFRAYPESTISDEGSEHGCFLEETGATVP
jgi:hypothetical protein